MKVEIKTLKGDIETRGLATFNGVGETKIESPKPPVFKGVYDAQEVENFL